jgi:hypothetical protein
VGRAAVLVGVLASHHEDGGMSRSGERVPTGVGAQRRRLTLAEAEAGCLPDRFTAEEWQAMHAASACISRPDDEECTKRQITTAN